MEYKRRLRKEIKINKTVIIFGVLTFLFAISWIPIQLYENEKVNIFDWIYSSFLVSSAFNIILTGSNYSFGKAFILINETHIKIKLQYTGSTQTIDWNNIANIKYKYNSFIFNKKEGRLSIVSTKRLKEDFVSELTTIISQIAGDKNIEIIGVQ